MGMEDGKNGHNVLQMPFREVIFFSFQHRQTNEDITNAKTGMLQPLWQTQVERTVLLCFVFPEREARQGGSCALMAPRVNYFPVKWPPSLRAHLIRATSLISHQAINERGLSQRRLRMNKRRGRDEDSFLLSYYELLYRVSPALDMDQTHMPGGRADCYSAYRKLWQT